MSIEKNKIESCKRVVLWMIQDRSTKPSLNPLTKEDIISCFITAEKKQRIMDALQELIIEEKIVGMKLENDKNFYYIIPPSVEVIE